MKNIQNIYKAFLDAFAELGVEFKLKLFFAEFLSNLRVDLKNKNVTDKLVLVFLKLSHEFYFMGLFHKKYAKNSDLFVKNYYNNPGYYE